VLHHLMIPNKLLLKILIKLSSKNLINSKYNKSSPKKINKILSKHTFMALQEYHAPKPWLPKKTLKYNLLSKTTKVSFYLSRQNCKKWQDTRENQRVSLRRRNSNQPHLSLNHLSKVNLYQSNHPAISR